MIDLYFFKDYAGLRVKSNTCYFAYGKLERFVDVDVSFLGDHVLTLTGWATSSSFSSTGILAQTTEGYWVEGGQTIGESVAQGNGQDYVNQIIRNNKRIYENNLLCAYAAKYMTDDDIYEVKELQNRLLIRNAALEDDDLTSNRKENYPAGYIAFYDKLDALMNEKIGVVISGTAMIVISAVVVAAVGAAAYFAYKAFAAESEDDVKFSDELTAKLVSKLSASELAQLYDETEGIVTSARLKEKFGTVAGIGSTLLWFIAGAGLLYWWQNRKTTTKKKTKKE